MKIKVKISKEAYDTLPPLKEGMRWEFKQRVPKDGEFILCPDKFIISVNNTYDYLTARQVPVKINLKKMLKELGLPMPEKRKGYKMQYAGVAVKGLKEYLYSFNGEWARVSYTESTGQYKCHYIELIPTKKLAKAQAKRDETLAEIERITK